MKAAFPRPAAWCIPPLGLQRRTAAPMNMIALDLGHNHGKIAAYYRSL